jgi:hypothetical protein
VITIFVLLALFQIKHLLADYFLQNEYMLGKFKPDWGFFLPLASHCSVHTAFTFCIVLFFTNLKIAILLSLFDFVTHFIVDRIKASPNLLGVYKKDQKEFWWILGIDQFSHHIAHYSMILVIVTSY